MPESYAPLRGRMDAVTVVFVIMAVVCAVAVVSDVLEWRLLDRIIAGENVTDAEAISNDNRQATVVMVQRVIGLAAVIVFIRWIYAAYRNVDVVAPAERRYGRGWAIGGWFVPIMAFFRPKQIVNDIWRSGGRDVEDAQPGWLLLGWWTMYLVASVMWNIASSVYRNAETAEEIRTGTSMYVVADASAVVAAILAILVVRRGTDRLDAKAAAVPPPPPAPEPDFLASERTAGAPV
jgi:hypothetical protein